MSWSAISARFLNTSRDGDLSPPSLLRLSDCLRLCETSRSHELGCFSFIEACTLQRAALKAAKARRRRARHGGLVWRLRDERGGRTACRTQLHSRLSQHRSPAQPRGGRLGRHQYSGFHRVSPATAIKGISLLESQLGMVVLHFPQFSLMTKSRLLTKESLSGRDFLPFRAVEWGSAATVWHQAHSFIPSDTTPAGTYWSV